MMRGRNCLGLIHRLPVVSCQWAFADLAPDWELPLDAKPFRHAVNDFSNQVRHSNTAGSKLGGRFNLPGTSAVVNRMGYGAMQLTGPGVFGPPRDPEAALAVLRDALAAGVNHIDTSDFYGPHVTNQIIRQALH